MCASKRSALDALVRAVKRTLNFADFSESDLIYRMGDFSATSAAWGLPTGFFVETPLSRISNRGQIGLIASVQTQKIDNESYAQVLGIGGMVLTAATIIFLAGRIRTNCTPSPDYYPMGRYIALSGEDPIPISILAHLFSAGRIGGLTLAGGHIRWRCASISAAHIEEPDSSPYGCATLLISHGRSYIAQTDVLADLRRFRRPLGILANFRARHRAVSHGFGVYRECSVLEAILIATDVF